MILIIFPAILQADVCILLFISDLLLSRSLIFGGKVLAGMSCTL